MRSERNLDLESNKVALTCVWRLTVALAAGHMLAACIAPGSDSTRALSDDTEVASVNADGLSLAARQAVEACGEGRVHSVRVVASTGPEGESGPPEIDFDCRDDGEDFDQDSVRKLAAETCGKRKVTATSMNYHQSGAVQSAGFRCDKQDP